MAAQYFNMPLVFNFIRVDEAYPGSVYTGDSGSTLQPSPYTTLYPGTSRRLVVIVQRAPARRLLVWVVSVRAVVPSLAARVAACANEGDEKLDRGWFYNPLY